MEQTRRGHLFRDALRYRWRIAASFLILGSLAGVLLAMQRPVTYASNASIIVNPLIGNPYTTEGQGDDLVNLQSESQLVTSDAVTATVAETLGIDPESPILSGGLSVTARPNTQILDLTVSGTDAQLAEDVALELSRTYLETRETLARDSVSDQAGVLQDRIDETESRLSTAQELATTGPTDERNLQARLADGYEADLFTLRAELIQVDSTPFGPGRIISPATDAAASAGITQLLILAVGTLSGLLLGAVAAVARERRANLVRGVDDVSQLNVPILVDFFPRRAEEQAEATSRLRMEVLGRVSTPMTLVVAPCSPHGSHHLPIALARSIADLGTGCVLIDADGEALPVHAALPGSALGLSDVMLGNERAIDVLRPLGSNLRLLPPGRQLAVARDLFVTSRLPRQIDELRPLGQLIIVQAPNLSDIAGEALSSVADGLILVITLHRTTLREVQRVEAVLTARGVPVLGAVVVHPHADLASTLVLPPAAHEQRDQRVAEQFPVNK